MKRLTKRKVVLKDDLGEYHLYETLYGDTNVTAVVLGKQGLGGKLSVNLVGVSNMMPQGYITVPCYGANELINKECFASGIFERVVIQASDTNYELWKILRDKCWVSP